MTHNGPSVGQVKGSKGKGGAIGLIRDGRRSRLSSHRLYRACKGLSDFECDAMCQFCMLPASAGDTSGEQLCNVIAVLSDRVKQAEVFRLVMLVGELTFQITRLSGRGSLLSRLMGEVGPLDSSMAMERKHEWYCEWYRG